ncbi:MAG TPA: DNA-binding response regulator [Actinophytocola sp.]|uniref:DNA-binding response regulator n=1 Tax=Actinophytocola sp. TaxID=1872138 RepID=UPI002DDCD618|nr:DNA-binding response regulator [Actinophytocola sp.]HEV2779189.1 DNA-binding response regulator [Actinophytocola sp.]
MSTDNELAVIRGHEELYARTWHLFEAARSEIACAANDLYTWLCAREGELPAPDKPLGAVTVRKLYRPALLLNPAGVAHVRRMARLGARIRITNDEINETIIIDRRVAILAGGAADGARTFSVVSEAGVVSAVASLFDAAWRTATEHEVYDRELNELREIAPRILEVLRAGWKDETAARALSLSVRTYRRRVAELMAALGASSRFQAGVRARELGLV